MLSFSETTDTEAYVTYHLPTRQRKYDLCKLQRNISQPSQQ